MVGSSELSDCLDLITHFIGIFALMILIKEKTRLCHQAPQRIEMHRIRLAT